MSEDIAAMKAKIQAVLQGTSAEAAEEMMDEALELDDENDELEDLLIELEMHAEKLRRNPPKPPAPELAAAATAAALAPAPPAATPQTVAADSAGPVAPAPAAPAPAPAPTAPAPASVSPAPASQPPAPAPLAPAPAPAAAPAPAPVLPPAPTPVPAPAPLPESSSIESPVDTQSAAGAAEATRQERAIKLTEQASAPQATAPAAAGSLFRQMAEEPASAPETSSGGGPLGVLGWASSLNSTLDDLSKVTTGVADLVGDAVGSAVVAAANDLGGVSDSTGPSTTTMDAGEIAAREVRKPRGLVGALGAFADAAVGGSTSDDNESDAAIGYTGRLQLYDDSSPVMVWSAFFGPPSCSIGWRTKRVICGSGCDAGATSVRLVRTDPPRAETEIVNATELAGAIALIYRGACSFTEKAQRAQAAGAVAVVFVNSDDEETHPAPAAGAESDAVNINIPCVCVGVTAAREAGLFRGLEADDSATDGTTDTEFGGVWPGCALTVVAEWLAVPVRPSPSAGRIVSVELQLGARAEGDGTNWSLRVYDAVDEPSALSEKKGQRVELKLVAEVGITVEVDSAEGQSIPLFKGLNQNIAVEKGQYVGLASADGPMNLARIASGSDGPGFWYSNSAVAAGPTTISLDHWDGVLNFAISIEDNELTATLPEPASAVPTQAPAPVDTGGGWGWGGLSSMVSSVASGVAGAVIGADQADEEDPMAALRKVSAERLQGNNQTPMSPQ